MWLNWRNYGPIILNYCSCNETVFLWIHLTLWQVTTEGPAMDAYGAGQTTAMASNIAMTAQGKAMEDQQLCWVITHKWTLLSFLNVDHPIANICSEPYVFSLLLEELFHNWVTGY